MPEVTPLHGGITGEPPLATRPLHDVLSDDAVWAIIEGAPDGIVMVDEDGQILLVNRCLEEMFGYDRGELLGKPIEVLLPERVRSAHVNHRNRYRTNPRIRPMGSGLELTGTRRDGGELPVEVSLSPILANDARHSLAIVRDVTFRKEAEFAVRRLQRLLDTSREAVFLMHSETFEFVYVNEGAAALTGFSRRELLGMTPVNITRSADTQRLRELFEPLLTGSVETRETQAVFLRPDGSAIDCDVLLQRFDWAERSWVAAFARDISDRLRAQAERLRAEQAMTLVDEQERIARDLHDTVIQSLFGIGMSLQAAAVITPEGRSRDRITKAVDDLDAAIRSLRTTVFALHEPSPVAGGLREEVASIAQEIGRSLGFTPAVRFAGAIDLTVPDDIREQLIPCLREMLANVAKHARAAAVEIELSIDRDDIILRVLDDGCGIPEKPRRGEGLGNLERRAEAVGGVCRVLPRPEGGTIAEWRVPTGV